MKEGWERTELPISLDLRQVNEIIKPAFPGKRVTNAERIGTGFSNSNYKIHLEGSAEPFVVRLYRGNGEIADKELAIAQLVRQTLPRRLHLCRYELQHIRKTLGRVRVEGGISFARCV